MKVEKLLSWEALEYEHREKNTDWYWAVGIIAVAAAVTAIILQNYIFAPLALIGGAGLMLLGSREPRRVEIHITDAGIMVDDLLYPFATMIGFSILDEDGPRSRLMFESKVFLFPITILSIQDQDAESIRQALSPFVEEKIIQEPFAEKVIEWIGF